MTGFHSGHFTREGLKGTTIPAAQKILTTGEMLQKAGYKTAGIGKLAPLAAPTEQGFDYFIGQVDQGACHNMYPHTIDSGNSTKNVNLSLNFAIPKDAKAARTACMAAPSKFNYTVDITHQQSINWITAHVSEQQERAETNLSRVPFFLYEAFTVPHAGGWQGTSESGAPVPTDGQYANETAWPTVERDHAAVITYLDNYVGELMALLQKLSIEEDTIVFFASDNVSYTSPHARSSLLLSFLRYAPGLLLLLLHVAACCCIAVLLSRGNVLLWMFANGSCAGGPFGGRP